MLKPDLLRQALATALPIFKREPERLQIFISNGHIAATGAVGFAFEYRYECELIMLDLAEHPDQVMAAIVAWLRVQQRELLQNHTTNKKIIEFEADVLDGGKIDLSIKLPLTERVGATPREDGGFDLVHFAEPGNEPDGGGIHWQLYLQDELIADWVEPE